MKSRLERIIEKLPKQELSAQKVELTALPNLIFTAAKDSLKEIETAIKKAGEAERLASGASIAKTDAQNRAEDAKRMFSKVLPQLKELGLKQDDIPDLKQAKKAIGEFNQKLSIYNSLISGLSKK